MKIQKKHSAVITYSILALVGGFGGYATYFNFIHRKDMIDKFERGKK